MKTCNTCPFIKSSNNYGSIDWLEDVVALIAAKRTDHTCHCTDKDADGYIGGDRKRLCTGMKMLKENNDLGFPIHKNIFKNYKEFMAKQLMAHGVDISNFKE